MPGHIDIIVPTIAGREDSLERFVASVEGDEVNVIVVSDSETCGWGWRQGLEAARGEFILYACDDQELIDVNGDWLEICTGTAEEGFVVCPRVFFSDGRIESNGGDMGVVNHVIGRPQRDRTLVDYSTIPFLSRDLAVEIGMLDVHYASDVWISYRARQLGYETILRHGFDVIHHREAVGRGAGMSVPERDALDCAEVFQKLAELEALV